MHTVDILAILQWWSVLFITGLVFLPFTNHFFPTFFDKGYIFSKILGSIIVSYSIFILGILHILPFSQINSWFVLVIWFLLLFIRRKGKPAQWMMKADIFRLFGERWSIIFWEEVIFLCGLFFWSYIRAFNPDIHGLEKYMDFGFINSILRSSYFPPKDLWFTPFVINYYYFGHLVTAVLTKLSGIPSNITFNLMVATIFSLTFSSAYSIGSHLAFFAKRQVMDKSIIAAGLLSAFLVTLGGNLHILYSFFAAYPNDNPVPIWQVKFLPNLFPNGYWYPNATRYIYHTIHEFPIYSWVVSDLHGHVLDIPIVLLTIGLLLSVYHQKLRINIAVDQLYKNTYLSLFGFLLAVMYMTNAWDGIIYLLLTIIVLFFLQLETLGAKKVKRNDYFSVIFNSSFLVQFLSPLFYVFIVYILFTLPYSIFFKPFVSGIGVLCAPSFLIKMAKIGPFLFEADHCQLSPWWQLIILYGFFIFFIVSFIIFLLKSKRKQSIDLFVISLIILSVLLIILPEFIYIKDIYPTYYRANTMFKLVFQAFIMLSLASGYVLLRFAGWLRNAISERFTKSIIFLSIWMLIALWLCGLVGLYPFLAVNSYYNNLAIYHGLDGTAYLRTLYPTDYAAIVWINEHIQNQPVILEAQGDSYTDYARVSSNTGLSTVLGWTVHEWLWRGSYDVPQPRINEVQNMYQSTDIQATKLLLQKYNVKYVFIGTLERQKYPTLDEKKFNKLGRIVYQNGITKIYELNI